MKYDFDLIAIARENGLNLNNPDDRELAIEALAYRKACGRGHGACPKPRDQRSGGGGNTKSGKEGYFK